MRFEYANPHLIPHPMRSLLALIFVIALAHGTHAQKRIRNAFDSTYTQAPNSKVFLHIPDAFEWRDNAQCYINPETGAHLSVEEVPKNLQRILDYLSPEHFYKKDYRIIESRKLSINKLKAHWYEIETCLVDKCMSKYILVIGNKKEYAMMEAYFPSSSQAVGLAMKRAMLGVYYDIYSKHITSPLPANH